MCVLLWGPVDRFWCVLQEESVLVADLFDESLLR